MRTMWIAAVAALVVQGTVAGQEADLTQAANGMLRRFGLDFPGSVQEWQQRQVDVNDTIPPFLQPELA